MSPRSVAAAVMCASLACASVAHAGDVPAASSAPTADDKKAASDAFREGDRAFKHGDYRRAAESYEVAYRRAPHHAPLWNAARAWERAGELSRAATLYAKYLREAPANAPDRNNATTALAKIAQKLARLDIHAEAGVVDVKVDDRAAEPDKAGDASSAQTFTVYVAPGAHVVEARAGDQPVRQSPNVAAGDVVGVALAAPTAKKDEPPPPPPPATPPPSHGWSPAIVVFGGAVTLITGGLAVWSGIDTLQQKDNFDKSPTQDNLDAGHAKQTRTNVLLGVSALSAVLTAATAIFLVDWHSGAPASPSRGDARKIELGFGLGAVDVRGSF